jgi:sec-independent protein translocase protein TatB
MFDIGFWELALIGVLALLVLGPKRLPEAARTAGKWVGRLRAFVANVRQDIDHQIDSGELEELRRLKEELNQTRQLVEESSRSVYQGIETLADSERTGNAISQPERKKAKKKKTASKKTASRKIAHKKSSKKAKSKKAAKKKTAKRAPRKG